jgi:hypothetical protein
MFIIILILSVLYNTHVFLIFEFWTIEYVLLYYMLEIRAVLYLYNKKSKREYHQKIVAKVPSSSFE